MVSSIVTPSSRNMPAERAGGVRAAGTQKT
jgi:hypothetical protein